jgi:protein-L-isoaspartate(D-aspartate) O-methyltransferase
MIPDWETERHAMVERQLRRRGIHDARVLRAMSEIPREEFVPPGLRVMAYGDAPVLIGWGQTISQPYMTALMAQELELTGTETVLEVGAGSGYAAAVLSALAARVVAVELVEPLALRARTNLDLTGRGANVAVLQADGGFGLAEFAPYHAISVAAAAPDVPAALLEQLNDPGRLVIPVGSIDNQELRVLTKRGGHIEQRVGTRCHFVPLRGAGGWQ